MSKSNAFLVHGPFLVDGTMTLVHHEISKDKGEWCNSK